MASKMLRLGCAKLKEKSAPTISRKSAIFIVLNRLFKLIPIF